MGTTQTPLMLEIHRGDDVFERVTMFLSKFGLQLNIALVGKMTRRIYACQRGAMFMNSDVLVCLTSELMYEDYENGDDEIEKTYYFSIKVYV